MVYPDILSNMDCPFCQAQDSKVIDSRLVAEGRQVRRRRECPQCNERFTTFEVVELAMPRVIKTNGQIVPFDEVKLRRSLTLPLQKRPVTQDDIDSIVARISEHLRRTGEREVSSRLIGEMVMTALAQVDQVAYVRFASVYRDFQDIEAFRQTLDQFAKPALSSKS